MAGIDSRIRIFFEGVDEVSSTVDGIGSKISGLGSGIEGAFSPFADAADNILAMNAALGAGAAALIGVATAAAGEFRDEMSQINTLLQLDPAGLEEFSQEVLAAAQNLRAGSLADLQESLYNAVSLGLANYTDALAAAEYAERIAVAGKAELNESLEFLLSTMNAYGAGVEEAERYSDAFFTTVNFGKTTIPELAASMSSLTGVAVALDVPIETLGAAIAAMTASGDPTSEAITKIRAALGAMLAPTASAAAAAKKLEVDFSAAAVKSKGFEVVLMEVYEATGGNVAKMAELFTSTEALQGAMKLGTDAAGTFGGAMEGMEDKAGRAAGAFDEMAGGMRAAINMMKNNVEVALVKVGLEFGDLGTGIIEGVTEIFRSLPTAIDAGAFDALFEAIRADGEEIRKFMLDLAESLPAALGSVDFSGLVGGADEMKAAFSGLFDGLDLRTPQGLADAIQVAADAVGNFVRVGAGIVEAWQPVAALFLDAVRWFSELDDEAVALAGNFLGFSQQAVIVGGAIAGIGASMSVLSGIIGPVTAGVAALASPVTGFAAIAAAAGYAAGTLMSEYVPAVDDAAQGIIAWADGILNFSGTKGKANESVKEFTDNLRAEIAEMKNAREEVLNMEQAIDDSLGDFFFDLDFQVNPEKIDPGLAELRSKLDEAGVLIVSPELDADGVAAVDEALAGFFDDAGKISVGAEPDEPSFAGTLAYIEEVLPDGTRRFVQVGMDADAESIDATKKEIEEAIPAEKLMKIQTELEIARLEAQSAQIESMLDYKAKVDVAEIEAAAAIMEAAFGSIEATMQSTADVISGALGGMAGILGNQDMSWMDQRQAFNLIRDQLEKENELRERAVTLQEELTRAQIAAMEARREQMERGEALIRIDATGLEVPLEMMFLEVIRKTQVYATAEGLEMLLGPPVPA